MTFPNLLVSGAGINLISNFELIVLSGIGASSNSIVIGAGGDSDDISYDDIVEVDINNLFTEIVFNQVCKFLECVVCCNIENVRGCSCYLKQLGSVDTSSNTNAK